MTPRPKLARGIRRLLEILTTDIELTEDDELRAVFDVVVDLGLAGVERGWHRGRV